MDKAQGALRGYNRERRGWSIPDTSSTVSSPLPEEGGAREQLRTITSSFSATTDLACADGPTAILMETFRLLAIRLKILREGRRLKKILITSAIPEEGKSMVAINLANAMALSGKERVVLVEGDLRRPTLGQRLGCTQLTGLTEYLSSDLLFKEAVYCVEPQRFYFLPAGKPIENGFELMHSEKLTDLFQQLDEMFEWIIIDSTPVVPMAETAMWTRLVDGVLVVARQGKTERRLLQKTLEGLDHCPLLGVVFNGCNDTMQNKYTKYYRYYHTEKNRK